MRNGFCRTQALLGTVVVVCLVTGCGGCGNSPPKFNTALNALPPQAVTANWQLEVAGQPPPQNLSASVGSELVVSGTFDATQPNYSPGYAVVECFLPTGDGTGITMVHENATLPIKEESGKFYFSAKLRLPDKPGSYLLRVVFQRSVMKTTPIELTEQGKPVSE